MSTVDFEAFERAGHDLTHLTGPGGGYTYYICEHCGGLLALYQDEVSFFFVARGVLTALVIDESHCIPPMLRDVFPKRPTLKSILLERRVAEVQRLHREMLGDDERASDSASLERLARRMVPRLRHDMCMCPEHPPWHCDRHVNRPCPEPGSGRHDPYRTPPKPCRANFKHAKPCGSVPGRDDACACGCEADDVFCQ